MAAEYSPEDVRAARAQIQEMRDRQKEIQAAAQEACEALKAIFKGFNVREVEDAMERVEFLLKRDMRV